MPLDGYTEYEKRSFCNGVRCPVQLKLNGQETGSTEYEQIRSDCRDCMAWKFHHWLSERGYLIVKPEEEV